MRLFDAHCHLQDERLLPDIEAVLRRAREAGAAGFACCGSSEADWPRVDALAMKHAGVLPYFGLHPWYIRGRSADWIVALEAFLRSRPLAGVGEIGLDHALKEFDPSDQLDVFRTQLVLARETGRAASIHCRRAWGNLLDVLREVGAMSSGFVVHSYSGSRELIPELIRLGGSLSFSGSITYPSNRRGRESAATVPPDRLLIETDAPDIPPFGVDPETANEPMNLALVLRALAEIRQTSPEALAKHLWENSTRLFGKRDARGALADERGTMP